MIQDNLGDIQVKYVIHWCCRTKYYSFLFSVAHMHQDIVLRSLSWGERDQPTL